MKVLKKGKSVTEWTTICLCTGQGNHGGGCGAKLLVGHSDLFETSHTDSSCNTEYFTTFQCPQCKVLTDIKSYSGPKVLKKQDGTPSRYARLAI